MTTAFQTLSHALRVGVPMAPINLAQFCANATSFAIVQGNPSWTTGALLPPGLTLSGGTISGTPTTVGGYVATARAFSGVRNPDASWNARKAGAYRAQRFDTSAPLTQGTNIPHSTWDTTWARSGAASMLQDLPAGAAVNDAAHWFMSTKVNQEYTPGTPGFASNTGVALGETLYFQFCMRCGYNYVKWPWPTTPKILMFDMLPWTANLNLGPTANAWEVVLLNRNGMFWGYENGPGGGFPGPSNALDNENWNSTVLGSDFVFQSAIQNIARTLNGDNPGLPSGAGPAWTSNQQTRAKYGGLFALYDNLGEPDGLTDPLTAAVCLDVLQPMTIAGSITVDTAYGAGNGRITWKVAKDGQSYRTVYDRTNWVTNISNPSSPFFHRDATGGFNDQDTVYPGANFNNLAFGADMSAKPYTFYNIDEILMGPNPFPEPDVGDGTSNYRTADILLTFKVSP